MKIFNKIKVFFVTLLITLEMSKKSMQLKRYENLNKLRELKKQSKIKNVKFTEK